MHRTLRALRILRGQAGFTVAELLAAVVIIGIGLFAVAAGFATAIQGVETGRQQSIASFLAEQRMEQVKAAALGDPLNACQGFANLTTACFPAQAYGTILNAPGFRSVVAFSDQVVVGGIVSLRRVDVQVLYAPTVAWGVLNTQERSVLISTLYSNHN
jgi:prepilin-type N-terminal cleavage/methylation domain-containing protein